MKQSGRVFLLAGCTILLIMIGAVVLEAGIDYQIDFSSRYIWRGFDLNPSNKPVLQPSVTINLGKSGLSFNWWGSLSFENKEYNESDLTLSYTFNTPQNYSLSLGFIHYAWYFAEGFTFKNNTSNEVYISAGLPEVFLKPNVSIFYDFSNGSGFYGSLRVGHQIKFSDKIGADLSASLGYNGKLYIEDSGFSDLSFRATVPLELQGVTISPFVNVVFVLLDEVNPGVDNEISFGVSLLF